MRKEYDFSKARKAGDVPHLARLQAESSEQRARFLIRNRLFVSFNDRPKKSKT